MHELCIHVFLHRLKNRIYNVYLSLVFHTFNLILYIYYMYFFFRLQRLSWRSKGSKTWRRTGRSFKWWWRRWNYRLWWWTSLSFSPIIQVFLLWTLDSWLNISILEYFCSRWPVEYRVTASLCDNEIYVLALLKFRTGLLQLKCVFFLSNIAITGRHNFYVKTHGDLDPRAFFLF